MGHLECAFDLRAGVHAVAQVPLQHAEHAQAATELQHRGERPVGRLDLRLARSDRALEGCTASIALKSLAACPAHAHVMDVNCKHAREGCSPRRSSPSSHPLCPASACFASAQAASAMSTARDAHCAAVRSAAASLVPVARVSSTRARQATPMTGWRGPSAVCSSVSEPRNEALVLDVSMSKNVQTSVLLQGDRVLQGGVVLDR